MVRAMPHQILILDDHPRIRACLRELVEAEDPLTHVQEATSLSDALVCLGAKTTVLLAARFGGQGCVAILRSIRGVAPSVSVIVVSALPRDPYALAAICAGADAFVSIESVQDELPRLLAGVHERPWTPAPPAIPPETATLV